MKGLKIHNGVVSFFVSPFFFIRADKSIFNIFTGGGGGVGSRDTEVCVAREKRERERRECSRALNAREIARLCINLYPRIQTVETITGRIDMLDGKMRFAGARLRLRVCRPSRDSAERTRIIRAKTSLYLCGYYRSSLFRGSGGGGGGGGRPGAA